MTIHLRRFCNDGRFNPGSNKLRADFQTIDQLGRKHRPVPVASRSVVEDQIVPDRRQFGRNPIFDDQIGKVDQVEEFGELIFWGAASFPGNRLGRVDARFESAELQKKKFFLKFCSLRIYYSGACLMG